VGLIFHIITVVMLGKLLSQFGDVKQDETDAGRAETNDSNEMNDINNSNNNNNHEGRGVDDGIDSPGDAYNKTINTYNTITASPRRGSLLLIQEINLQQQHNHQRPFFTHLASTTPSSNHDAVSSHEDNNHDDILDNNITIPSPRSFAQIQTLSPGSNVQQQQQQQHHHLPYPRQSQQYGYNTEDMMGVGGVSGDGVGVGGGVSDHEILFDGMVPSNQQRRMVRELLPMSGMRSKRSIIDPRSLSTSTTTTTNTTDDPLSLPFQLLQLPTLLTMMMDNNTNDFVRDTNNQHDQDYDFNDVYDDYQNINQNNIADRDHYDDSGMLFQESTSLLLPEGTASSSFSYYGTTTTTAATTSTAAAKTNVDVGTNENSVNDQDSNQQRTATVSGTVPATTSMKRPTIHQNHTTMSHRMSIIGTIIQQLSAVAIVGVLNMMIAIPFGASYFPVEWKSIEEEVENLNGSMPDTISATGTTADSFTTIDNTSPNIDTVFPLPGKEALGLRMFLFATMMGQLVLTYQSRFVNAIGLQMVENVPFLHALAYIVFARQGYGPDALSTLFFLFGLSSIVVGIVFFLLGKFRLGKVVYFFPNHVLVGCIGGIGVFILFTALEVTTNVPFQLTLDGIENTVFQHWHLLWVVLVLEFTLRVLMWATQDELGRPKFQLLTPLFYISITPLFYWGLWIGNISITDARDMGYFFPSTNINSHESVDVIGGGTTLTSSPWMDPHLFDIFHIVQFNLIDWMAVLECTSTVIALVAFSLIHVPINIPAFAISTDVESDMNAELIAHGWSNGLSGIFGGLQNYMTYSNSVLYAKTGGTGKVSSIGVVSVTAILFVVGPSMCDYLPRCMAGTLLLHIGIDLVLEGVYDSFGQYDYLEYAGIWVITIVMTFWGMTAALIAGVIAALSTYAVQSINYHNPIRQILSASTLRSSAWARNAPARAILDDDRTGRGRILVFQLQGHVSCDIYNIFLENKYETFEPQEMTASHSTSYVCIRLLVLHSYSLGMLHS
jgi:MFS superfamily sulfate permease-like transporter